MNVCVCVCVRVCFSRRERENKKGERRVSETTAVSKVAVRTAADWPQGRI